MKRRTFLQQVGSLGFGYALGSLALSQGLVSTSLHAASRRRAGAGATTTDAGAADTHAEALRSEHILQELFARAGKEQWSALPLGVIMARAGHHLVGTPYVGATLEAEGPEQCQVNFCGLDCVTFFENCLAFARCVRLGKHDMKALKEQVTITRYRNGELTDYTSRLHYTTEWLSNNETKHIVRNITQELGAEPFLLHVDFMSQHPQYYRQLKADTSLVAVMGGIERRINEGHYFYIPKDKVARIESKLQSGDIIAIATSKKGLDYAHTGMIEVVDGKAHFLHASLAKKQVTFDATISEYLQTVSTHIGISVARPIDPRSH